MTECITIYRVYYYIQSVLLYTECITIYRVYYYMQSVLLYTECITIYRVYYFIPSTHIDNLFKYTDNFIHLFPMLGCEVLGNVPPPFPCFRTDRLFFFQGARAV